jgi:solute carrier family 25 S-adenosylmethionine transporter 26
MAFKFAAYESLRQLHTSLNGRKPNAAEDFAIGAFSGSFAAAATTPLDVIKTNMMCNASARPSMVRRLTNSSRWGHFLFSFFGC